MRTTLAIMFFLLAVASCTSEREQVRNDDEKTATKPTVGIGRLQVSLNRYIPLYRTNQDSVPFDFLLFSQIDNGQQKGSFLMLRASLNKVNPLRFYRGDSEEEEQGHIGSGLVYFAPELVFKIVALTDDGFEVVLNEDTYETAVIRQDEYHTLFTQGKPYWQMGHDSSLSDHPWFLCELWQDYFERIWYVDLNKPQLYDGVDGGLIYSSNYLVYFKIKELVGEWARVETYQAYWEEDDIFPKQGWIRWTDGEALLVDPIEEAYY